MQFQSNISASAVQSGTFTGTYLITGSLQTGTTNPRVTIDSTGINAYNNLSVNTFKLASSDGSITINGGTITGGLIRTAVSGKRIEINTSYSDQIRWYSGDASETAPAIAQVNILGSGTPRQGSLTFYSPSLGSTLAISRIDMYGASFDTTVTPSIVMYGDVVIKTAGLGSAGSLTLVNGGIILPTPSGQSSGTAIITTAGTVESTLLTLTITTGVGSGGVYEVWFQCYGTTGTVLADVFQFTLYSGAVAITACYLKVNSITPSSDGKFLVGWVTLPAGFATVLTAKLKRNSGTGTLAALATVSVPMVLTAKAVIG